MTVYDAFGSSSAELLSGVNRSVMQYTNAGVAGVFADRPGLQFVSGPGGSTTMITRAAGGMATSPFGRFLLSLPPEALSADGSLAITPVTSDCPDIFIAVCELYRNCSDGDMPEVCRLVGGALYNPVSAATLSCTAEADTLPALKITVSCAPVAVFVTMAARWCNARS